MNYLIRLLSIRFFIVSVCIACQQTEKKEANTDTPPNILLIVSEDHGPHLSCYGDTIIHTPHLDNIANEGMLFKNAYVIQSVCSSSSSSILTDLFPHQNGHLGLASQGYHFVGEVDNIYALLKKSGYGTGMIVKLHLHPGGWMNALES